MRLGQRLKDARLRYTRSRAQAVRAIGIPEYRTWTRWEDGTREPEPWIVNLIASELARRHAEREGLGHRSCTACGYLAVEDDGRDDRYGCVACGARMEP